MFLLQQDDMPINNNNEINNCFIKRNQYVTRPCLKDIHNNLITQASPCYWFILIFVTDEKIFYPCDGSAGALLRGVPGGGPAALWSIFHG